MNGVDDLLALWGPSRVLELFENSVAGTQLQVILPPQFQSRSEGMFRVTQKGERLSETQLSNYRASIITNILLDDGVETKREFEIEAELLNRTFRFTIPSSQFGNMDWPMEQMGPAAITLPNQREYTTAIQYHSMTAEERCIYIHTGWREIDGQWVFIHAGGAVGEIGEIKGMKVQLYGSLSKYELRLPASSDELKRAVRTSLRSVELGPPSISFPLRAATYRALFGNSDFAIHLVGETGAFKSELAALEQQFFGAQMNRLNLPGSWSSTGNALELLAFHAKDSLIVIDDFAPHGSAADVSRYHAAANRVFRAAGNHAGRGRLDSSARLRESKPPRGLILSTGEDICRSHPIRARLLILELSKGLIRADKLTECQKDAASGVFAEATGAFVRWIARRYDDIRAALDVRVTELRLKAVRDTAHARTPEIVANLQAAFEIYLQFSEVCGAIDGREREQLTDRCCGGIRKAAAAQAKHQAATEPTERYLDVLRGCLSSGRVHLAARDGAVPKESPESCGWRRDTHGDWSRCGECIGWIDGGHIYLESTVAYGSQIAGRDSGEVLAVSEQTLKKRLRDKNLLASTDTKRETLTVRKTIAGSKKEVLHLSRATLLFEEPDDCDIHYGPYNGTEAKCRVLMSGNPHAERTTRQRSPYWNHISTWQMSGMSGFLRRRGPRRIFITTSMNSPC